MDTRPGAVAGEVLSSHAPCVGGEGTAAAGTPSASNRVTVRVRRTSPSSCSTGEMGDADKRETTGPASRGPRNPGWRERRGSPRPPGGGDAPSPRYPPPSAEERERRDRDPLRGSRHDDLQVVLVRTLGVQAPTGSPTGFPAFGPAPSTARPRSLHVPRVEGTRRGLRASRGPEGGGLTPARTRARTPAPRRPLRGRREGPRPPGPGPR